MGTIQWIIIMLGFSMVAMGLGLAFYFTKNEEKKNSVHAMALQWKARIEKDSIQKEGIKLKEAA